jgi:hypothetical protein
MPYKCKGTNLMVLKKGKWVLAPGGDHKTRRECLAHQRAAQANVKEA